MALLSWYYVLFEPIDVLSESGMFVKKRRIGWLIVVVFYVFVKEGVIVFQMFHLNGEK